MSRLYELLTTASFVSLSSQHKWEQDLSIHLSNAHWDKPCITKIHNSLIQMCKISNSSNTDLAQGIYNTKQIKEMDKSLFHLCWHGCGEAGTLIHLMWHCPSVKSFWKNVICTTLPSSLPFRQ